MAVYVLSKNEKTIYTSVNPSFTIYKMGVKGYTFHGRITVILFGCGNHSMWVGFTCLASVSEMVKKCWIFS